MDKLLSNEEEEKKLQQVQKGTNKLVLSLLKTLLVIILSLVLGAIPVFFHCLLSHTQFDDLIFNSFLSILMISVGATVPFVIPLGKKVKSEGYNELSKLLHRMSLNNYHISNRLFKWETKKIERKGLVKRTDFVIISGLARAGTTSLMNNLAQIDAFVSLSYANMPFLLCPNLWGKFYKPKKTDLKERSHKDGIMIGLNSNEALEEYFFKVKANDSFISDTYLSEYSISNETYNDYLEYQTIIKNNNDKIYLAKNNNFILRYKSVRELNEDFLMIILYREPLTHATSLLEKHREYKKIQKEDTFVLEYMNWLGHHEFGMGQKTFLFRNSEQNNNVDKESLDYWLKIWINYYRYILTIKHQNTILINYESYCNNPKGIISTILDKIHVDSELPDYNTYINNREIIDGISDSLKEEALIIYKQLNNY